MLKRILFVTLALSLAFSGLVGKCFADAAAQLQQARDYKANGYFSQAEGIYKAIVADYSGTDSALEAQKQLVFVELQMQKKFPGGANPQAALDKLLTDFAGNGGLPEALYDIAAEYERLKKYQKAKELYGGIIQNYPNTSLAAKATLDIPKADILALIKSGQAAAAQAAIDSFVSQFSSDSNIVAALNDIAYQWRRYKNYPKAIELYQYVADTWPSAADAMLAQMGVAKSNVEAGNFNAAVPAIDRLLSNYSAHPYLPTAIHYIARRYRKAEKYQEAKSLYQQIIQRYPNTSHAGNAQIEITKMDILAYINAGNHTAATTVTDKLLADFSGHLNLARMLYEIPWEYERLGRYADAKEVCQKIITNCPDHFRAKKAAMDIRRYDIFVSIEAGQDDKVVADIDKLIVDFAGQPYLPDVLSQIAKRYYKRASQLQEQGLTEKAKNCLNKAAAIWDGVIRDFSGSAFAAGACGWVGDCYRKLGDYEKSNLYYQKVIDDYSGYYMAWQGLFMIGRNYEKMGQAGVISESQGKADARSAYEQLLAKYPDCKAAKAASNWLSR